MKVPGLRELKKLARGHTASGTGTWVAQVQSTCFRLFCSTAFQQSWPIQVGRGWGGRVVTVLPQNHCRGPSSSESRPGLSLSLETLRGCTVLLLCTCPPATLDYSPSNSPCKFMSGCFIRLVLPALFCCPCQMQSSTFKAWSLPDTPFPGMHRKSCFLLCVPIGFCSSTAEAVSRRFFSARL